MGAHALKRGGAPLGDWCKTRAAFDPTTLGNRALMHQRTERARASRGPSTATHADQPMQVLLRVLVLVLVLERGADPRPRFYCLQ
jgi:hypothetical protein